MWDFLKRFMGYTTQAEPVAPYKVEAPVGPPKCGCGRSPSGDCTGLHKLSDAEWAARQAPSIPVAVVVAPVPTKAKKVVKANPAEITAKPNAVTTKPVTAKPKAAPKVVKPKSK